MLVILLGWSSLTPAVARADNSTPAASQDDLGDLENRFKSVADKVSPAVVAISACSEPDDSPAACRQQELSSDKLQAFLSKTTRMVGTGFIIDSDGYILTNDHVIDDSQQLWITMDDRKVYPAIVVGSDPRSDLAVLKIPGKNFPTVHLGNGSVVRRGQWSIAIGNPYGLSGDGGMCLSVGVVSAVNRSLPKLSDSENRLYLDLIQTTAQINPGNSGGPLFDLHGDVIGINTAVIMPQKAVNGIGFAMPITGHLLEIVNDLKQGREVVYGYLGIVVSNPSDEDRQLAGVTHPVGVHVDSIQSDSPADGGAIRCGDLITAIGGRAICDSDTFVEIVGTSGIVHPVTVELMRSGKPIKIQIALRKRQLPVAAVTRDNQRLRWAGMLVGPVSAGEKTVGLQVLTMDANSPLAGRGLHEGSIIRRVAGKPVDGVMQLQDIINEMPFDQCNFVTGPDAPTFTADLPMDR
jgi:serine protease Do